ncbi:MAG: hypothetical protein ACLUIW_07075 [Dysosmobacter welbionis]
MGALAEQLLSAGYTRCEQVEGVGQFALRGGILDVFSPLMDQPVRCEFFDDEIDSMGAFDPGTQRRIRNVSSARILPAAEVLPHCAPGGLPGLADQLTALAEKLAKKQKTEAIVQTLREDAERLRSGAAPGRRTGIWQPSIRLSPPGSTTCLRTRWCSSVRAAGWTSG